MPIYAYRCAACGHSRDVLQKMSDPVLSTCPVCGADQFQKQVTAAGFQLKGSGWYVTDFKGGAAAGAAAPPATPAAGDGAATPAAAPAPVPSSSGGSSGAASSNAAGGTGSSGSTSGSSSGTPGASNA